MNEKQAKMVVELVADGFEEEALVLVKAYADPVEDDIGTEIVAMPQAVTFVKSFLRKFFVRMNDNAFTKLVSRIASALFSKDLDREEAKEVTRRVMKLAMAFIAVLAPIIIYLIMKVKRGEEESGPDPYLVRAADRYMILANDNLRDMKRQLDGLRNYGPRQE